MRPGLAALFTFIRERVLPLPIQLLASAVYFTIVLPYGLLYRAFAGDCPFRSRDGSNWRPWKRTSDSLEKARLRY